jgi:hypothetical protein
MRSAGAYWTVPGVVLVLLHAGCGEELGPEQFRTTRVSGRLVWNGKPVGGGWVEFHPTDGTVGNVRSAPVDRDGRFEADGVAVGWNMIGVADPPLAPRIGGIFHPLSSPIRRRITEPPRPLRIDLLEEAARWEKARGALRSDRGSGGPSP